MYSAVRDASVIIPRFAPRRRAPSWQKAVSEMSCDAFGQVGLPFESLGTSTG